MRHRVHDKKFNRDANERKALLNSLLRSLAERGSIVTSKARAKVLKRLADKMVTQAKDSSMNSRRILHKTFGKRDVVNTLVDRVAPALQDRTSGYTRIEAMGPRRGDNTEMVKVSFVNMPEGMGTFKSGKSYESKSQLPKPKSQAVKPAAKPRAKKAASPAKAAKPESK